MAKKTARQLQDEYNKFNLQRNIKKAKSRSRTRFVRDEFYQSQEWRMVRYQALKLYGRKCACCGATPETGAVLHVDHIKPRSRWPSLALSLSNLQILCADCNLGKGASDCEDYRVKPKGDLHETIRQNPTPA